MDSLLQKEMRKQQKEFVKPDLNAPLKQREDLARQNMANAEKVVDEQIFSGEMERSSQKRLVDYTHNYIYSSIESEIKLVNSQAHDNIRKYRKAEPTQKDIEDSKKIKQQKAKKVEIVNKPAKAAGWKKGAHESAVLEANKELNPMLDLNGVRETESLIKYQNKFKNYIDRTDAKYESILTKNTAHAKNQDDQSSAKRHLNDEMLGTWPFMKLYKKGWFGRIYTLDGKRIKTKKGQLTPDEYNKELMEAMTLQTEKKVSYGPLGARSLLEIDDETLRKNREKKAVVLRRITKELLDYKLDANQLTDEYLADHITEIQQYADKLNAFEKIYGRNQWFFHGGDKLTAANAKDQNFLSLLENRIFKVSHKLNDFLDEHYCCHGVVRKYNTQHVHNTYHGEDGFLLKDKPLPLDKTGMKLYREEHLKAFGNAMDFYDTSQLSAADLEKYKQKVETVRGKYNDRLSEMQNDLTDLRNSSIGSVAEALNDNIKDELDKIKKKSDDEYKEEVKSDKDLVHVPYDLRANGLAPSIELSAVKKNIISHAGFYPQFAPEVNKLYSKMYATSRLEAELYARKRAIEARIYEDTRATEKKAEKAKRDEEDKKLAAKLKLDRPINEKNLKYTSKNPYAGDMLNSFIVEEVKKIAKEELADVDRKLEYLKANQKSCRKAINYFLNGAKKSQAAENLDDVQNYCKYERMETMFNAHKIDSYDAIMQQCKAEVRVKIKNKDTGENNPIPQNIQADQLEGNERNERLYTVRHRVELHSKTDNATTSYVGRYMHEPKIRQFADIATMSMADIQTLASFKDEINFDENGGYKVKLLNLEIFARDVLSGKDKDYTEKHLKNDQWIRTVLYDTSGSKLSFEQFKAEMQVKFEILAQHSYITDSLFQLQLSNEFAYFDIDSLKEMTDDELDAFDETIKAKYQEAQNHLEDVRKNPTNNAEAQDHRIREATENCDRLEEFQKISRNYITHRKAAGKYLEISPDLIQTKTRERMRENRLNDAKQNKFVFADQNFLEIEDMFADEEFKKSLKAWPPSDYVEEREKNKNVPMDEKKTMEMFQKRMVDLLQLHIGEDTIELLNTIKDREDPVNIPALKKLLIHCRVLSDFEYFIDDSAYKQFNIEPSQYQKDMKALLERPENGDIRSQLEERMALFRPMIQLVKNYLHTRGFSMNGDALTQYSAKSLGTKGAQNEAINKLNDLSFDVVESRDKLIGEINRIKDKGFEGVIKDYTRELFDNIYKEGVPLDLKNMDNWKARVKKMTKKGFFGENKAEMWLRLTAQNMLDNWPYSFHEFYSYHRMREDANQFKNDLKKLGITKDEAYITRASEISQVIKGETMGRLYALDDNETKEFDRQLLRNHWDPDKIKLLMRPVETTDTHAPKSALAKVDRRYNSDYAKQFRSYLSAKDRNDLKNNEVKAFKTEIINNLMEPITFGIKLKADMANEQYIQEHFAELYKMAITFGGLQELYKHEKEFLHTDEAKRQFDLTKNDYINLHNAYDYRGSVLGKYFDLIMAYAELHCVNEEGGLSVRGKTQEKALEKMSKSREKFEQLLSEVGVELRRKTIAENAKRANHVSVILDSIEIKGGDKMIKMVQKSGFEGHIQDVNLFLQNDKIAYMVNEYSDIKKSYEDHANAIRKLENKGVVYTEETGQLMPQKDFDKLMKLQENKQKLKKKRDRLEAKIRTFHTKNQYVYDSYVGCHDEKCNLNLKDTTGTNPINISAFDNFERFHNALAPDMRELFEEAKTGFAMNKKKYNNSMFNKEALANNMRSGDWPIIYRNYRKLNLYLSLLEQDLKHIGKNDPVFAQLKSKKSGYATELSNAKAAVKKFQKTKPNQNDERAVKYYENELEKLQDVVKGWERRIKGIDDTVYMLTNVFTKGNAETIETLREYCTQMDIVYREHGVTPDGELFENNIGNASGQAYSEEEQFKILHEDEQRNREVAKEIQKNKQK